MKRAQPLFQYLAILTFAVLAVSLSPLSARAQAVPTCQDWGAVSKWNVTLSYAGSGSSTDQSGNSYLVSESGTITGQVGIDSLATSQCPPVLDASGNVVGGGSVQYFSNSQLTYDVNLDNITDTTCEDQQNHSPRPQKIEVTSSGLNFNPARSVNLVFDFSSPTLPPQFKLGFSPIVDSELVSITNDPGCGPPVNPSFTVPRQGFGPTSPPSGNASFQAAGPLPSSVTGFSGTQTYVGGSFYAVDQHSVAWTVNWTITPVPPNLDLVVETIPDYRTWRPSGGSSEKDPGFDPDTGSGELSLEARLIDKDTGLEATVNPEKVTFLLADVSHEPGVVLNFPASGTSDPDLTFQCLPDPFATSTCALTNSDTEADFTPIQGESATSFFLLLVPHDWGAWGTLNVTAMVAGTQVKGHLQLPPPSVSDPNATDILLPQRQPGSFIADTWKTAHSIPLDTPDTDDQEDSPNGNSGYKGDGLTLYEEYRGFYVPSCPGCSQMTHREGDPTKKDLFVINIDRAARPDINDGIKLFQSSTGLNVCCRTLTVSQITPDRIVNFNHANGPHEVDQHAVLIGQGASGTNGCTSLKTNMPSPPIAVNRIFIPPLNDFMNHVLSYQQKGLVVSPAITELQSMVAHELGHASSIWHHGADLEGDPYWYSPDGSTIKEIPKGTSKSAVLTYVTNDLGTPIRVFTEGGGRTASQQLHAGDIGLGQNVAHVFPRGEFNGTHGGDVMCFMRYDSSTNYVAQADPTKRYYAGEFAGLSLTNTVQGTGTNRSPRTPQSRYGSAQSGRGDCSTELCINDNVTPGPRGDAGSTDACAAEQSQAP